MTREQILLELQQVYAHRREENMRLFEEKQDTMWKYLRSVKVTATGDPFVPPTAPAQMPTTVQDLTLLVPVEGYTDISAEVAAAFDFTYMLTPQTVIMGLREAKDTFPQPFENLDGYAQAIIDANHLVCTLEHRDGLPYLVYTSDDGEFTYVSSVFEGTDAYWFIQSYCFTEDFPVLEDELWLYVSSCSVN